MSAGDEWLLMFIEHLASVGRADCHWHPLMIGGELLRAPTPKVESRVGEFGVRPSGRLA